MQHPCPCLHHQGKQQRERHSGSSRGWAGGSPWLAWYPAASCLFSSLLHPALRLSPPWHHVSACPALRCQLGLANGALTGDRSWPGYESAGFSLWGLLGLCPSPRLTAPLWGSPLHSSLSSQVLAASSSPILWASSGSAMLRLGQPCPGSYPPLCHSSLFKQNVLDSF